MKRKATTWTVVGFCLLLAAGSALLGSCNKGSEKAREKAAEKLFESMLEKKTGNEAKVDLSAGKIKVESEGTKTEIDQASNVWPEDIPAAVPRFSWGKISGVTKSQSPEGQFWGVNCAEVPADASSKYDAALKAAGFESNFMSMGSEGVTVAAQKGTLTVSLVVGNGSGYLSIQNQKEETQPEEGSAGEVETD